MKYGIIGVIVIGIIVVGIAASRNLTPSANVQEQIVTIQPTSSVASVQENQITEEDIVSTTLTPTRQAEEEKGSPMKQYKNPPEMTIDPKKTYIARLETNKGTMTIPLFANETPQTVNNFVFLAKEGYYANTPFHRILKGFMIQGGDPTGTGTGSPGYRFPDETISRDYLRGTLAMANAGPDTNGSQFFVMHQDYPLPKNYVIFGKINPDDSESLKTLDAIANVPVGQSSTGEMSRPTEEVRLLKVTVDEQ